LLPSQCHKTPNCWTYKLPRTSCNKSIALYYSNYRTAVLMFPLLLQATIKSASEQRHIIYRTVKNLEFTNTEVQMISQGYD